MSSQERQSKNTIFRRIARSVAAIFSAEAVSLIGAVALSIIIGRRLGAEALGIFSYSFALAQLARIFVEAGFDLSLPRELARDNSDIARKLSSVQSIKNQLWLLTVPLLVLFTFLSQPGEGRWVSFVLVLWLLPRSFTSTAQAVFRGIGQARKGAVIESISMSGLYLLGAISLGVYPSLLPVVWLFVLAETLKALWLFVRLKRLLREDFAVKEDFRLFTAEGFSFAGIKNAFFGQSGVTTVNVLNVVYARAAILALGWSLPLHELGEFSAATRFITPLRILPGALFSSLLPEFSHKNFQDAGGKRFFLRILVFCAGTGLLVSSLLWLAAPLLMEWTFGFGRAVELLRILTWFFVFDMCNQVLEASLLARHEEKFVSLALGISSALLIFGILGAGAQFGLLPAAWLSVLASALLTALYGWKAARRGNHIRGENENFLHETT